MSRSYESNGPDVKIRGTALHVAEKYVQLARDAQSAGDRVAAESYFQHAEHYYRIIAAAQAQMPQPQPIYRQDEEGDEDGDDDGGDRFSSPYGQPPEQQGRFQPDNQQRRSGQGDQGRGYGQQGYGQSERGYQQPERGYADRPQGERSQSERGQGERGQGERGQGERYGDRPRSNGEPQAAAPGLGDQPVVNGGGFVNGLPASLVGEQPAADYPEREGEGEGFRSRRRRSGRGRGRRQEGAEGSQEGSGEGSEGASMQAEGDFASDRGEDSAPLDHTPGEA